MVGEQLGEGVHDAEAAQPAAGHRQGRVQFVEVPAQPALDPGALGDQVPAMVDQQPHLAGGTVELGDGQAVVTQGGEGDCLGVDRVGLARLASATSGAGHQPGRDAHHTCAGAEQVTLEATGQMPAVLEREADLLPLPRPGEQLQVPVRGRCHGQLPEPTSDVVERDDGVGALVRVGSDHHHAGRSSRCVGTRSPHRPGAGTPQLGRAHAPIKPRLPDDPDTWQGRTSPRSHRPHLGAGTEERSEPCQAVIIVALTRRKSRPA